MDIEWNDARTNPPVTCGWYLARCKFDPTHEMKCFYMRDGNVQHGLWWIQRYIDMDSNGKYKPGWYYWLGGGCVFRMEDVDQWAEIPEDEDDDF